MAVDGLRAGAARISLDPPPGLPMIGFVRRHERSRGPGPLPLETTAVVLEHGDMRVAIVGVDTLGIQSPEVDALREQVAAAVRAPIAGVLLNWNHTHCAPPGGRSLVNLGGDMADELDEACAAYVDRLHERIVEAAELAAGRLEPARPVWGEGRCAGAVNRRERAADGRVILGWNREGAIDLAVPTLQLRRPDETAIATVVGYGCHTVTVGWDVLEYDPDFPGPLREAVRAFTGGECVYLQGAAGNVLPQVSFLGDRSESERLGRRLALAALASVGGSDAWPTRIEREPSGSVTPMSLYRRAPEAAAPPALAAVEEDVVFPLQPLPTPAEIGALRAEFDGALHAAQVAGEPEWRLNTLRYNAYWARRTEAAVLAGAAPTTVAGPVSALRIGDGAIVTGPGEVFTEIGIAVKERSPAAVTLYAGFTNGAVSYLPTAAAFPEGGYEPGYGNRSYGLPVQVTPDCERLLVETGVRLVRSLFPEKEEP